MSKQTGLKAHMALNTGQALATTYARIHSHDAAETIRNALDSLESALGGEEHAYLFENIDWHGGDVSDAGALLQAATRPMVQGILAGAVCAEHSVGPTPGNLLAWDLAQQTVTGMRTALRKRKAELPLADRAWFTAFEQLTHVTAAREELTELLDRARSEMAAGYLLGLIIVRTAADSALTLQSLAV